MMQLINPKALGTPSGYSNGVLAPGGLLFVAGQVAWDQHEQIVSDRFAEQFERALANILAVVTDAGGTPESLMKLTIFVTDKREYIEQRREVGEKYRRLMGRHYPAMTLVEVKSLLEPGARVEIEGVAFLGGVPVE
jgi:enamine deaminase RidA (YjgF/YER057c/UK114 family)